MQMPSSKFLCNLSLSHILSWRAYCCLFDSVWVEEGSMPGCTNCVMNDLDLTVKIGDVTYFPNGRNGPDRDNSAERVIVEGVQNGVIATITVDAFNLAKREQQYALVITGCFGDFVPNQLYAQGECSAFECDDSQSKRLATILMAIFIPLGVILILCGIQVWRKKKMSNAEITGGNEEMRGDNE